MTAYPVPRHAVSAWIAGDQLWIAFPPLQANEQGHSVPFTVDPAALRALAAKQPCLRGIVLALEALKARNSESTVGTKGSPARHDIQRAIESSAFFKAWEESQRLSKAEAEKERKEAEAFLQGLGL